VGREKLQSIDGGKGLHRIVIGIIAPVPEKHRSR
jgi:hypothetical protein